MKVSLSTLPSPIAEALFGLGLSYGLTSKLKDADELKKDEALYERLVQLSVKLCDKQGGHNKFLESLTVGLDITAPRYWWQEFDTYRAGVTKQSESTMHTLALRPLADADFEYPVGEATLKELNKRIAEWTSAKQPENRRRLLEQLKNRLPEGYLQRRIVVLNFKALQHIYAQRKSHKLATWNDFFDGVADALGEERRIDTRSLELYYKYIFGGDYTVEEE